MFFLNDWIKHEVVKGWDILIFGHLYDYQFKNTSQNAMLNNILNPSSEQMLQFEIQHFYSIHVTSLLFWRHVRTPEQQKIYTTIYTKYKLLLNNVQNLQLLFSTSKV